MTAGEARQNPAAPLPEKGEPQGVQKAQTLSAEELAEVVRNLRAQGRRIVFANGCFDFLHVGHIRYLTEARSLGDVLVVAVNDDASARALKGEGRPWTKQEDRMEVLSALSCVDYLVLFGEKDVSRLLRLLKPHIHAKGTDYTVETVPEREVVLAYGGQIAITGDPKTRSSSDLVERARSEAGQRPKGHH